MMWTIRSKSGPSTIGVISTCPSGWPSSSFTFVITTKMDTSLRLKLNVFEQLMMVYYYKVNKLHTSISFKRSKTNLDYLTLNYNKESLLYQI